MKFGIMAALISLFSITTLADEGIKFEMGAQFPKTISIVGYDANEKIAFDANGKVRFYLQRETTTVYKIYFKNSNGTTHFVQFVEQGEFNNLIKFFVDSSDKCPVQVQINHDSILKVTTECDTYANSESLNTNKNYAP